MLVSVCIATFNGSRFIREQLNSILNQLSLSDEVIIVDDCSIDNTVELISSFNDNRIKIFNNEYNLGHIKSFSKAVSFSNNGIIFFSDQDDIWTEGRFNIMKHELSNPNILLVTANSEFIDDDGKSIDFPIEGVKESESNRYFLNIVDIFIGKTNYYGCCMAFKRELLKFSFPIPNYVESHDLWFAIVANVLKKNKHLDFISLKRRIHGNNASVINRSISQKIFSRILFFISCLEILKRKYLTM